VPYDRLPTNLHRIEKRREEKRREEKRREEKRISLQPP